MKTNDEHPLLVAIATTIADGLPVDWEHLTAEHPELARELRSLRELEKIRSTRAEPPSRA
jgi:hypothetical protein